MKLYTKVLATAFQFLYMMLAIDNIDGHGFRNEVHPELLSKKTKLIVIYFTVRGILPVIQYGAFQL